MAGCHQPPDSTSLPDRPYRPWCGILKILFRASVACSTCLQGCCCRIPRACARAEVQQPSLRYVLWHMTVILARMAESSQWRQAQITGLKSQTIVAQRVSFIKRCPFCPVRLLESQN